MRRIVKSWKQKVLILPFIIDETKVTDLPWHIQNRNVAEIAADHSGVETIVKAVRHGLEQFGKSANK